MILKLISSFIFVILGVSLTLAQTNESLLRGANEQTPSRSQYFSWINHTNEGPTEEQTLKNLAFFKWLHDRYGMVLDVYAFDVGAIDGRNFYGSIYSKRFKDHFPSGLDSLVKKASLMGTRLGVWGGPDGFGNTKEEEAARTELMVKLCKDYHFALFKFDAVCGILRPEKEDDFVKMMTQCRKYSPDLILLNHRLDLGKDGNKHATTFLLGGAETYIDVHLANKVTATHHRVEALSRELTPKLTRLAEDHGVCLSSCMDYWEDDLILHAFNRSLILSPELYGNPWLLRDDEYATLARIFNLQRKYNKQLVSGKVLPEKQYGLNAVSRGDNNTRFITLRNMSWETKVYTVALDSAIGLSDNKKSIHIKQYHPTEKILGEHQHGSIIKIEVLPFRSCLVKISNNNNDELAVRGVDYKVINDKKDNPVEIKLLGLPGEQKQITLEGNNQSFKSAKLDNKDATSLLKGKTLTVSFPGTPLKNKYHRKLGNLETCALPQDAASLYEATQFAADNNSLEARSLARSGPTKIPEVQAARDAFFQQPIFIQRETWDKYLFDGDDKTAFSVSTRWEAYNPTQASLRIDLGEVIDLDSVILKVEDEYALQPYKSEDGEYMSVSQDLKTWKSLIFINGTRMKIDLREPGAVRYLRFPCSMIRIQEVEGYKNNKLVDRSKWKASNLQRPYVPWHWDLTQLYTAQKAWKHQFTLNEIPKGSYLCIAINGTHGIEGAVAALKINDQYIGCPDRSPSYKSNTWEYRVIASDKNYTYYLPLTEDMKGKSIEAYVLSFNKDQSDLKPEVWITAYPAPFEEKTLILK